MTIGLAAAGGAAAMYLYLSSVQKAASANSTTLTLPAATSG